MFQLVHRLPTAGHCTPRSCSSDGTHGPRRPADRRRRCCLAPLGFGLWILAPLAPRLTMLAVYRPSIEAVVLDVLIDWGGDCVLIIRFDRHDLELLVVNIWLLSLGGCSRASCTCHECCRKLQWAALPRSESLAQISAYSQAPSASSRTLSGATLLLCVCLARDRVTYNWQQG